MTNYSYVSGGYQLNPTQQDLLRNDLATALKGIITNPGLGGQIYTDLLSFIAPGGTPLTGVDPYVVLWLQGAIGVNANSTAQATVIRTYTQDMYQILYGTALTDAYGDTPTQALNRASNQIAITLAQEILAPANNRFIPDITTLGTADAGSVTSTLFGGIYAPWAGTILFPYLNTPSFYQQWLLNMGTVSGTVPNASGTTSPVTFKSVAGTYNLVAALETFGQLVTSLDGSFALAITDLQGQFQHLTDPSSLATATISFLLNSYGLTAEQAPGLGVGSPFGSVFSFPLAPDYIAGTLNGGNLDVDGDNDNIVVVNAGPGNDTIIINSGLSLSSVLPAGVIDGEGGINSINYSNTSDPLTFTLENPVVIGGAVNPYFNYRFEETSDNQGDDSGSEFLYDIQNITGNSAGNSTLNLTPLLASAWNGFGQNLNVNLGAGTAVNLDANASAGNAFFVNELTGGNVILSDIANDAAETAATYGIDVTSPQTISMNGNSAFVLQKQGANEIAFDADTYSGMTLNMASNSITANLTTADGTILGTLVTNETANSATVTIADGETFTVTGSGHVVAQSADTSPLQTLQDYLDDLGFTGTLSALNYTYDNPAGKAYTVAGSVSGSTDTFTLSNAAPGAVVTGKAGDTNVLDIAGGTASDLSQDAVSGVQVLDLLTTNPGTQVTATQAELAAFSAIKGAGTIIVTTGGTFSLLTSAVQGSFNLIAEGWGGTTLIGGNQAGETLTASLFGNDTLKGGTGAGDKFYAGAGVDTITTGSGAGDFVIAQYGLAPGSSLTGGSSTDTLATGGDISGATVTGVHTLQVGGVAQNDVTLNAAEFNGFATIFDFGSGNGLLTVNSIGTYSLNAGNLQGSFTVDFNAPSATTVTLTGPGGNSYDATGTGAITLNASGAAGTTLTASGGGNDTLTAQTGDGGRNALYATGDGDDILTAGNGAYDTLTASGDGNDTLTAGTGTGDTLSATGIGASTLTANGANAILTAANGTDTLTGNGSYDQLSVTTGGNTLIAGNGLGETLTAQGGDNTLSGGSGGDTFNLWDTGNQATGGAGNDTFNLLGPSDGTDAGAADTTTLINGGGGRNTLNVNGDAIEAANDNGIQQLLLIMAI